MQMLQYALCLGVVGASAWSVLSADDWGAQRALTTAAAAVGALALAVGWWLHGVIWLTFSVALIRIGRPVESTQTAVSERSFALAAIVSLAAFAGGAVLISSEVIGLGSVPARAIVGRPALAETIVVLLRRYGIGACAIGLSVLSVAQAVSGRENEEV